MANVLVDETALQDIADAIRTKNGTQNTYKPGQMADAIEAIPSGGITPTGTVNINSNGTHNVAQYASANVNVPNSYAASDEGKVVSNGALVAQGSDSVTQNGTVDTTLIKSLTVNVPTGSTPTGTKQISITQNGTVTEDVTNYASAEISVNVSSGGGDEDIDWTPIKPVTFVDYDGTILYTYTASEFLALSAMPANPSHDGLTAQGWNATLAEAQAYVQANGMLCIGQNYTTSDGKTRIYITVFPENVGLNYYVNMTISNKNGVVIDWGDGNSTTCDANDNTYKSYSHSYSATGDYVITITANTGTYTLGRAALNTGIFWVNSPESVATASTIKAIRFGDKVNQIMRSGFNACYNLETISIPTTLLYFGESSSNGRVFYDNTHSLKCVVYPKNSVVYGTGLQVAMNNMRSLRFVSFAPSMTIEGISPASTGLQAQLFFRLRMFTTPNISNSELPSGTLMYGAPNLEYICVPGTYTTLTGAFLREVYKVEKFTVPATVTTISQRAMNSSLLKELHMLPTTPPTLENTNAMPNTFRLTIYVPYSADHSVLAAYKSASNWSSFASIIQEEAS